MTVTAIATTRPNLPTVEWTYVTPRTAREFLGSNTGNRSLRGTHVAKMVRDLKAGNFLITGDAIRFDRDGRLIDGQHRCQAIISSGVSIWLLVIRDLDPRVQIVLDGNAKRTGADALHFDGVEKFRTAIAAMARLDISRKAGFIKTAGDRRMVQITNAEVVDWTNANPDAAEAAKFGTALASAIYAAPTSLAYAYLILSRIDQDEATEFFLSTAEMRTDGPGDPRATLIKTFQRDRTNGTTPYPSRQLSYIFRAWNAYRGGAQIKKLPVEAGGKFVNIPEPR